MAKRSDPIAFRGGEELTALMFLRHLPRETPLEVTQHQDWSWSVSLGGRHVVDLIDMAATVCQNIERDGDKFIMGPICFTIGTGGRNHIDDPEKAEPSNSVGECIVTGRPTSRPPLWMEENR